MLWPIPARRLRRAAVIALAAFTLMVAGFSRYALPTGLGAPAEIPPIGNGYVFQVSGFVDIPPRGSRHIGVAAYGGARVVLDGDVIVETRGPAGAASDAPVAPGVHRILVQYERLEREEAPFLYWIPAGEAGSPIPRAALSPRRLSPAAWILRRNLEWLAVTVALLWLAVAVTAGARRARTWFDKQLPSSHAERRAVQAVIAFSAIVFAYPFWWGVPASWSQDELLPVDLRELAEILSPGWASKYPPMHYYVLAAVNAPFLAAARLDLLDTGGRSIYAIMKAVTHLTSVSMAVATTALVYLTAARAAGPRVGILAGLVWTLTLPAAFYSKTGNLDIPYTFWFAVALLLYQRALDSGTAGAHVLCAGAASLAVVTKDQAYGLFLLPAAHLAVVRARRLGGPWFGLRRLARDPAMLGAIAVGALTFAAAHNLPVNWAGFRAHVATITGGASEAYRMVESTSLEGQLWLLVRTVQQIGWSLSWPGAVLAATGIVFALRRPGPGRVRLLPFLLPAISYYLTFIAVVGYSYDRFVLPICVLLAIFAGLAFDRLWPSGSSWWRTAAAAAILVFMTLRTVSINLSMAADSRYEVQRWMQANLAPETEVVVVEDRELLPDLVTFSVRHLLYPLDQFAAYRSPVVVLSENYRRRFAPDAQEVAWHDALVSGQLGYRIALRHRTRVPLAILSLERQFRDPDPSFSVLHKVNPEIVVLVRDDHAPRAAGNPRP